MSEKRIVILAGKWETTPIVYNYLKNDFIIQRVVIEEGVSKKDFLKKRINKLGWLTVLGQVCFQVFISKPMGKASRKRMDEISRQYNLSHAPIAENLVSEVSSVNANETIQLLNGLAPDLVIVHGTRIIARKVLQAVSCPFVNVHAGITPRYRGSHGAYWALANNDKDHCGVTVHLVDAGIDTGNILSQKNITITQKDNFTTYPLLQLAEGLRLLKEVIPQLLAGTANLTNNNLNSALWHHPTLWSYLIKRLRDGVK